MRSKRCAFLAVLLSVSAASAPAPGLAAPPAIYNLGTFHDGLTVGRAVNASGQVTGYSISTSDYPSFLYTGTPGSDGVMHDLGIRFGNDINDAGQVVGATHLLHACLYTGTPGSGGAIADLGTLGGDYSTGVEVNDSGQVAGYSTTANGAYHAFLYTGTPGSDGVMHDLGTLVGDSIAMAVNAAGQVVGWSDRSGGNAPSHAFLYTGTPGAGGQMIDLGTLGGAHSFAQDINDAGQIVGSSFTGNGAVHAFLYTGKPGVDGRMIDLDAWLDANNPVEGAKWTLTNAYGLSNNGWITGSGDYNDGPGGMSDGSVFAFLLDASSLLVVPEPSSLALLALAVPALMRRRQMPHRL